MSREARGIAPSTTLERRPSSVATLRHPELHHVTCCRNDDLSLCGFDVSDEPWVGLEATCVVCADLDNDGDDCPFGGMCP